MDLLTNTAVEERLLKRVRAKAATYGKEVRGEGEPAPAKEIESKIPLDVPPRLYKEFLMPLTKDIEVRKQLSSTSA